MINTGAYGNLEPVEEGTHGNLNVYLSKFENLFVISFGNEYKNGIHIFRNDGFKNEKKAMELFNEYITYESTNQDCDNIETSVEEINDRAREIVLSSQKNKVLRGELKNIFNEIKFKPYWRFPISVNFNNVEEGIKIVAAIGIYHHNAKVTIENGHYNVNTWGYLTH